jgi:DNA-binding NarL/FixJ family response regulator
MANSTTIQVLSIVSNDDSRLNLREFLAGIAGVSLADEATNPSEALQKLENKYVDVVLLDLAAQDVDAIELTRQIRQSHPSVRVLITTASNKPEDIFAAMDAGADGYALKGNHQGLEMAIRSLKLGTVWLDPGIAQQVLEAMVTASSSSSKKRTLPTGLLSIPLMPDEKELLHAVASSSCVDGVCMVDPAFVRKLRRLAPSD